MHARTHARMQVLSLHRHYVAHPHQARRIAAAGEAFARRYLSYGTMQCFWRVLLEEYSATVGGFRSELLDDLLRRGDALPLTLGALPVRFAGPDNRTDSSPVAVSC